MSRRDLEVLTKAVLGSAFTTNDLRSLADVALEAEGTAVHSNEACSVAHRVVAFPSFACVDRVRVQPGTIWCFVD
jgi:hypothetical protein